MISPCGRVSWIKARQWIRAQKSGAKDARQPSSGPKSNPGLSTTENPGYDGLINHDMINVISMANEASTGRQSCTVTGAQGRAAHGNIFKGVWHRNVLGRQADEQVVW